MAWALRVVAKVNNTSGKYVYLLGQADRESGFSRGGVERIERPPEVLCTTPARAERDLRIVSGSHTLDAVGRFGKRRDRSPIVDERAVATCRAKWSGVARRGSASTP